MRRLLRTLLFVLLICAYGTKSFAERVEPEVARTVAATFLSNNGVRSNQLTDLSERAGFSNLYIFNGEEGFVILAADDRVKPILGYSLTGRFVAENMPENLRWWLQSYNDEIQYAIDNQLRTSSDVSQEWEELRRGRPNIGQRTVSVGPLISTEWGQDDPYNLQCPTGCVTGCVATAMAQIMKKWNYPTQGQGSHTNLNNSNQTVNFGETTYQWNKMINSYANGAGTQEQKDAVATLMYHCGVSVDMTYGTNASSAYDTSVPYALNEYFKYSNEAYYAERDLVGNDDVWKSIMKGELDAGRPLFYGGDGVGSHAFVCDGYASGDYFHFNWGWWGQYQDTYFSIDVMIPGTPEGYNFSNHQDAVFGIFPPNEGCNTPTNLSATLSGRNVTLSWTAAPNVDSYRIYRNGVLIAANVIGTSYIDNSLEIGFYTYYLRSNGSNGSTSAPSYFANIEIEFQGNVTATIGNLRYSLNEQDLTAEVIGRKNGFNSGSLTIPSTVSYTNQYDQTHTYTVVSIGSYAFSGCTGFTGNLTIPNTVVVIGDYAFRNCRGFTGTLAIPNSVTSIGRYAFYGCTGFTGSLTIGNSVTSIDYSAFSGCSGFTGSLTIGNSVTSIDYSAFSGCSGFSTVYYNPTNCADVSNSSLPFSGCGGSLVIGNNVERIPDYMFKEAGFNGSLTIGNSVTSIGQYAFYGCTGFTGSLTIPNSVTAIGSSAFYECSGFTGSLTIPNSVTAIGSRAFYECSGFTGSLTIGNSVTSIGESAFYGCTGFTGSLTIPNSVTLIGNFAFSGCSGFTGGLTIGNSVTSIGRYAFYGCTGFTGSLTIGNSVTSIDYSAFSGCSGFTGSLTIGNSVTSIGQSAFSGCSGFTGSLTIGNSVTSIGQSAFSGCSGFSTVYYNPTNCADVSTSSRPFSDCGGSLVIGNNVERIPDYMFKEAGFNGSLTIGNSVTSIGRSAFSGCSGFSTVYYNPTNCADVSTSSRPFSDCGGSLVIGNNVERIPDYMFQEAGFNGSLTIGSSVTSIGEAPFSGCSGFSTVYYNPTNCADYSSIFSHPFSGCGGSLVIGDNVERIPACLFEHGGFNGSLTIGNSVTSIGGGAFDGCTGFTGSLTIPNSVASIGGSAFSGCSGFTGSLTIGNSVTSIGQSAFSGCSGFTGSLTIGNSVTSIGQSAFSGCSGFSTVYYNPTNCADVSNSSLPFSGCGGSLVIGNNVERIPDYMFKEAGFNGSLTIGNSVTSIGQYAFSGCSGFTGSLTIPNSVTAIGSRAFYECSGFTGDLTISNSNSNSVLSLSLWAFYGCRGFTGSLTIGNSVTSIANQAFEGCSSFTQIVVDNGNTVYDSRNNCNAIIETETNRLIHGCKNTIIPNSVNAIGVCAFSSCTGLTSIEIPNSVTSIHGSAFYGCTGLTSITIPNLVNEINDYAFACCTGLTSLDIPNSVTIIGLNAFDGCTGLTSIDIPESVIEIKYGAFKNCTGLSSITINTTNPQYLGITAFDGTLCPIYVPYESLTTYVNDWSNYEDRIYPFLKKSVAGYSESTANGNWAFIASPLAANIAPTAIDNMLATTASEYDLYRFNQAANGAEWQNYKAHTADFMLANGKGYLYANKEGVNIVFKGEFNEGTSMSVDLDYTSGKPLAGWNLVGNPFPYSATVNRSYYMMNGEGTGINPVALSSGTSIAACTGVMVKADNEGESVTFEKVTRQNSPNSGLLHVELVNEDKAIVSFNQGDQMGKYYFGQQNANVYIPQQGKEYAIACADGIGEKPLNFKATKDGEYTLNIVPEGVEMNYLHLIDEKTGADVDLLITPSYTFAAKATDNESSFKLVFRANDDLTTSFENFAYLNNGNLVLACDYDNATLQIVDVLGRVIVSHENVSGSVSASGIPAGVYVLRLIHNKEMKVQKIVIQ